MQNRIKHTIMAIAFACVFSTTLITVMAGEVTEDVTTTVEATEQKDTSDEDDPVAKVNSLIKALDAEDVSESSVEDALEAYDALSTAQKLQVENYEILEQAEKSFDLDNDSDEDDENVSEDSDKQKNGTSYNFRISEYKEQLTLTLRLVVDADGDGNMDIPDITVKSPDNTVYTIGGNDSTLSNEECNIDIIRTSSYIQMDVTSATDGIWQVETSSRVVFELSEYTGDKQSEDFAPTEGESSQTESDDNEEKGNSPLLLVPFFVLVAGVFVFIKKIPTKNKNGEKKKDIEEIDDGAPRPLTKEEEIAKIRAEWANSRNRYDDEDVIEQEQIENIEDDLAETIEDTDEEDLEEFDIGFFGHSRFTKEDDE